MTSDDTKMVKPISKEEMIDILKGLVFGSFDRTTAKEREALDLVIKALEQQPCEDCISRQAVLDNAYAYGYGLEPEGYCVNVEDIQALPSVTPSRPKGHWILIHPLQEDDDGTYICSNCEHGDWDCDTSYKYCPFCGADMREVRENDR